MKPRGICGLSETVDLPQHHQLVTPARPVDARITAISSTLRRMYRDAWAALQCVWSESSVSHT